MKTVFFQSLPIWEGQENHFKLLDEEKVFGQTHTEKYVINYSDNLMKVFA